MCIYSLVQFTIYKLNLAVKSSGFTILNSKLGTSIGTCSISVVKVENVVLIIMRIVTSRGSIALVHWMQYNMFEDYSQFQVKKCVLLVSGQLFTVQLIAFGFGLFFEIVC